MNNSQGKAVRIRLSDVRSPQMRAFHLSWLAFFLCFFAWFGVAPLMAVVRDELGLTKEQIGNTVIASVAITILARLVIGWLCDRYGPRKTYAGLLMLGALPVAAIALAETYEAFLVARLAIGTIGASFVITQYHTSLMFAPNCVGTANATTAGWGNLGGGVTQLAMPVLLTAILSLGVSEYWAWRLAMVVPSFVLFFTGIAYLRWTQDTPHGNFSDLRAAGATDVGTDTKATFWEAARDRRVWALCAIYGACFGVELTVNNVAALYFHDRFELGLTAAGLVAGLFGLMNVFARTLGGFLGDRAGIRFGLNGRVAFLGSVLLAEGIALIAFAHMSYLPWAITLLVVFSLFVQASEGATFSIVPLVNKRALGSVAGIVGAGGNAGAVAAGFLFRSEALDTATAFFYLGLCVTGTSALAALVRFSPEQEKSALTEMQASLLAREGSLPATAQGAAGLTTG